MTASTTTYPDIVDAFTPPIFEKNRPLMWVETLPKAVFDALSAWELSFSQSSLNYWPKGKDTLTLGNQISWMQLKHIFYALEQSYNERSITTRATKYDAFLEIIESQHVYNYIEHLKESAYRRDSQRFATLVKKIDWSTYLPGELANAIDMALSLELASLAIELAQQGVRLFPTHKRIQYAAQILATPVVRTMDATRAKNLGASRIWLHKHAAQYRSQWIAVRDGKLLGTAKTLKELKTSIGADADSISTIVTKVL